MEIERARLAVSWPLISARTGNAVRLAPFGNLHGARVLLDKFAEGLPERRN